MTISQPNPLSGPHLFCVKCKYYLILLYRDNDSNKGSYNKYFIIASVSARRIYIISNIRNIFHRKMSEN